MCGRWVCGSPSGSPPPHRLKPDSLTQKVNIANNLYLPPPSNTGVQNTERIENMIQGNKFIQSNGLYVSLDWASFTLMQYSDVYDVVDFLGFDARDFKEIGIGGNGYRNRLEHFTVDSIKIYFDGANDNMGIHVDVSGNAISTLLEAYCTTRVPFGKGRQVDKFESDLSPQLYSETLTQLFNDILEIGHFTRIDLAIDDFGSNYYSTIDLIKKRNSKSIVSKWREIRNLEKDTLALERTGHTVYFGSKESEIMLRVYDKQLEQNLGLSPEDEKYIKTLWTRWELQLRGERANQAAKLLASGINIGSVTIGILSHYFRIIQHDDCNRSRCSNELKWDLFVNEIEKLSLTVRKCERTLEIKEQTLEHQYGGRIAMLVMAHGGDISFLQDMAHRNVGRISPDDISQFRKELPDMYDLYFDAS